MKKTSGTDSHQTGTHDSAETRERPEDTAGNHEQFEPQASLTEEAPQESKPQKQKKISTADKLKFFGLLVFIAIIIAIGVALLPYFEHLTSEEGRLYLIGLIKDAGVWGVGICLLLQFVQVVVAFIPGEVTQLAIGAIYGPVLGSVITIFGALISSIFVFF